MPQPDDTTAIRDCIRTCADKADGRARRWARQRLQAAIVQSGASPAVAAQTAMAAQAVGLAIREVAQRMR